MLGFEGEAEGGGIEKPVGGKERGKIVEKDKGVEENGAGQG